MTSFKSFLPALAFVPFLASARTTISNEYHNIYTQNGRSVGEVTTWEHTSEEPAEISDYFDSSSEFYHEAKPTTYSPYSSVTNSKTETLYGYIKRTTGTIRTSYRTGYILTKSGMNPDFSRFKEFTSVSYSYTGDLLIQYGVTSILYEATTISNILRITKTDGIPQNPPWLYAIYDGKDSQVTTDTEVPVPNRVMRSIYPNAAVEDLTDLANSNGANGYPIWQCYLLYLDPTQASSKFTVDIHFYQEGVPFFSSDSYAYRFVQYGYDFVSYGKTNLTDTAWTRLGNLLQTSNPPTQGCRFFKFEVEKK